MTDADTLDAATTATAWSSGLSRSYSDHAALVLQHYENHRSKHHHHVHQHHYPEAPKYTRSGPNFRHHLDLSTKSEADDEDEDDDNLGNQGQRTWRISPVESDYTDHQQQKYCKMSEIKCRGDSNDISTELSEMTLADSPSDVNFETAALSRKTRTTISSSELQYRRFEDEDYFGGGDGNFLLMKDDSDFMMSDEMKFIERLDQEDDDYGGERNHEMVVVTESSTSLATSEDAGLPRRLDGKPLSREISYENWARDKHRELQRRKLEERIAEEKKREKEEMEQRAREEKEQREYECYLEWVQRKKKEKLLKKKLMEKEECLKMRIKEVEDKAKLAKDICLKEWMRKKEEQQKAFEREQLLKRQRSEEEKQQRLQESSKAYEKWREKAKNAPRPATQGLLPHQTAKPTFTNPKPWQPLVENLSDDSETEIQPKASRTTIRTRTSSRRSLVRR